VTPERLLEIRVTYEQRRRLDGQHPSTDLVGELLAEVDNQIAGRLADGAAQAKLLTELSTAMRSCAANAESADAPNVEEARYYQGKTVAYHDAAFMVDALMTGPAMQITLDAMDAQVPE